jgi:hypothetical protein
MKDTINAFYIQLEKYADAAMKDKSTARTELSVIDTLDSLLHDAQWPDKGPLAESHKKFQDVATVIRNSSSMSKKYMPVLVYLEELSGQKAQGSLSPYRQHYQVETLRRKGPMPRRARYDN